MAVDLHFICKHGENHRRLELQRYETGDWVVSDATADEAIGGRVYLHERQDEPAWHGGTILGWRAADEPERKVFTYAVDGPFRIRCSGAWGREKAIVRR